MLGLASACSYSSYIPFSTTKSLAFDGTNDYLDVGDNLDLGTGDFSISMWVYVTEATDNILMSKWQDANNFWVLRTQVDDKVQFIAVVGGVTILSHISNAALGSPLDSENRWVHVVYTNDRSNGSTGERIYIDGVLKGAGGASSTTDIDNTGRLYIGRYDTTYTHAGTKMDEVAIWNYDLNSDHVAAIYDNGNPTELTSIKGLYSAQGSLQAWWRMGDGAFDNISVVHDQVNPGFGSEEVTNGTFDSDTSGWTALSGAILTSDSGLLKVTNDGTGSNSGGATQQITTVVGKTYQLSIYSNQTLGSLRIGTSSGASNIFIRTFDYVGVYITAFIATTITTWVTMNSAIISAGAIRRYDNVSVKEVNGNPALVIGGVTSFNDDFSNSFN
tara:strand:+ start:1200 stop:2360 length:1161 start_codon:yes stop_codon:yes gene_type:complete